MKMIRTEPSKTEPGSLSRRALSAVEVLVCLGIIGILTALALPAVQQSRERARTLHCGERLRGLAMAAHAHEAVHRAFPYTATNSFMTDGGVRRETFAISPHRHLLPYIDRQQVYERIDFTDDSWDRLEPGKPPNTRTIANRELLQVTISEFLCPSDSAAGGNNYRANLGPGVSIFDPSRLTACGDQFGGSGAFVHGRSVPAADFRDGLSHTILFSERIMGDGDGAFYTAARDVYDYPAPGDFCYSEEVARGCQAFASSNPPHLSHVGWTWLFGGFHHTWYNHVLTPNSATPDCLVDFLVGGSPGAFTARSFHPGGVNAAVADGSVRFISNSIDAQVWRAAGTRKGDELLGGL